MNPDGSLKYKWIPVSVGGLSVQSSNTIRKIDEIFKWTVNGHGVIKDFNRVAFSV